MKPERIQFAPKSTGPTRGVYQTFRFGSFRKALRFSDAITEMADNHGRAVSCSIDSHVNELVILVPAAGIGPIGDVEGAQTFLGEVGEVFEKWSSPTVVS